MLCLRDGAANRVKCTLNGLETLRLIVDLLLVVLYLVNLASKIHYCGREVVGVWLGLGLTIGSLLNKFIA